MTRDVVSVGMWRSQTFKADFGQIKWDEFFYYHGAKWLMLNPNETNRQISRIMDEMHRIADSKDQAAMENYKPIWNDASRLKNPAGRIMTVLIFPPFKKSISSSWASEDQRQSLLIKLTEEK